MSGVKYVLDTNYILGILKSDDRVLRELSVLGIFVGECAYSSITRMELLGFPKLTEAESDRIGRMLKQLRHLPLTHDVEDIVIDIRKVLKIKLPDAIIAATACSLGAKLLTLDRHLLEVLESFLRIKLGV